MYNLTDNEKKNINNYWKFIEYFFLHTKKDVLNYRINLILNIRKHYSLNEFYNYEKILNKLLYNLLEHLQFTFDESDLTDKCNYLHNTKTSYSHKRFIQDEKKNINYDFVCYKEINNNKKILQIFTILSSKKLYNEIMNDKKKLSEVKIIKYYYPLDYSFPNVNMLFYNQNKKKTWISRIKKLYYTDNNKEIDNEWYNFALPEE